MIFIANWKLNKSSVDVEPWISTFLKESATFESQKDEYVIAASAILLPYVFKVVKDSCSDISISSQDISAFDSGAHTGEVSALQLKDLVKYSIVGHSEKRALGDTNEIVLQKIKQALANNIIPICCFSNIKEVQYILDTDVRKAEILFAYEPLYAIGTGNAADPTDVQKMFEQTGLKSFIYGGSVNPTTIKQYATLNFISGFLIGSSSLNAKEFSDTIKSANLASQYE